MTTRLALLVLAVSLAVPPPSAAQGRARGPLVGGLQGSGMMETRLGTLQPLPWLAEHGYASGDFRFAMRSGEPDRLPELARQLVAQEPAVIVAEGMPAIRAAKDATGVIPIVMVAPGDPVRAGFVRSLARPGGNVTGVAWLSREVTAKQLELLRQVAQRARRVGVLWNPAEPDIEGQWVQAQAAAAALGWDIRSLEVRRVADIPPAFETARREGVDALLVLVDRVVFAGARQIIELAALHKLPAMYTNPVLVGPYGDGLIAFAPNRIDVDRLVARYVARILKGARPSDLPVEQPDRFDLVVNLKAARAAGLTVPPSILLRADRVVD